MREILFRGKRVDNGEFVYGFYVKAKQHWHKNGIHEDWIITSAIQNGGWFTISGRFPVMPETVGEYIGIEDMYGDRIFEGDKLILTFPSRFGGEEQETFEIKDMSDRMQMLDIVHSVDIEIIGTIHN